MNQIKARMKSVGSTTQITKAMELVASSKLRRAKERAEKTRPYYEALERCIDAVLSSSHASSSVFTSLCDGERTLYVVIAGDRGLAGGYNSNVFRLAESLYTQNTGAFFPIGKKACEHLRHLDREILNEGNELLCDFGVGASLALGERIVREYTEGRFQRVILVYTRFVSIMTQTAVYEQLLPLERDSNSRSDTSLMEGDAEDVLERLVCEYVGGIIYSAICESTAAEHGARRSAMNSANKNAEEMMNTLMLKYNRARQAVITQEITEIVSGAEAL